MYEMYMSNLKISFIYLILFFYGLSVTNHIDCKELYIVSQPARIGGCVSIGNQLLTNECDLHLSFVVTDINGKTFEPPAEDKDGLNTFHWYLIDIPIYDPVKQPGGAKYGETGLIHVYQNLKKLELVSPENGKFVIGASGSVNQIDIVISEKGIVTKGDINDDGFIDLKDIILVLSICSNNSIPLNYHYSKLNTTLGIKDAIYIFQMLNQYSNCYFY